ncbi:hypothetical protein G6O67_004051 [Ophiocordyceps sinensis]|uniref:Uncharacterized protein n=2 Tax=Ophiocordyceps sinensis TaxID=72228 RepID=A0A8H4PNC7_9HYPO|nr:hypothetical protein OCS_06438 [Ophiocordyceps sinensis CO18]KAF4507563.1 hypothetical protein G6O67_004051 [Ophiocordyceps sinensis]
MEDDTSIAYQHNDSPVLASPHRRASSGPGLLSRLPFSRSSADAKLRLDADYENVPATPSLAVSVPVQQHRSRRRRGSLRKVALLGRGAQRDKKDNKTMTIDTVPAAHTDLDAPSDGYGAMAEHDALGLKIAGPQLPVQDDPPPSQTASERSTSSFPATKTATISELERDGERANAYASTTDEEDILHMPSAPPPPRASLSMSSGSESYFANRGTANRQRSFQQAKSPLSYSGISINALPPPDSGSDYTETEWWGWVVLTVTWFVFVMGMGSCLDVWSWAWDVGKTPYAPPELEDDPTLPIVGYYPALIIMTGVMAWVWVVAAWVGMKYFRHAKISGD